MSTPGDAGYRSAQRADLIRFAAGSRHPLGFGWLDSDGRLDPEHPVELWISCRMTHVASLGVLAAEPPAPGGPDRAALESLAEHGVASLSGPLMDHENGGWYAAVGPDGPVVTTKQSYGHAFVILAASSARAAGIPGAEDLLARALEVNLAHFWDERAGLSVEEWDAGWTTQDTYNGINANMHTVEAYLAAGDVTGDGAWHRRASRISERVLGWAAANDWRIPEHFDREWNPMLEFHRDEPAHPFRPYGATVGHALEWSRLLIALDATLGSEAPTGLVDAAVTLAERAVVDGWAADGADGFVYTTDWSGRPVVRERMHWVLAEAISAAGVLHRVTGDARWAQRLTQWWEYADRYVVDHERGSWRHELDPINAPAATVWAGKPDVYHAYQAALGPDLPIAPSYATALARRT